MAKIADALGDLLSPSVPLRVAAATHFASDYRQRTNGKWDELGGFLDYMAHLRGIVCKAHVEVIEELIDGDTYADRHIVSLEKGDGIPVVQEVYLFGRLDDRGRFRRIEEVTLMLEGTEADRDIGSAR